MKKILCACLILALTLPLLAGAALAQETERDVVNLTMLAEPANDSGLQTGNWWSDYLKDELQITLEIIPNADGKLQALLAADSLPDIVIINTGTDKIMTAIQAGQLVPLSDHAQQLPHAYENCESAIRYYADNLSEDGKTYMLSNDIGPVAGGHSLNYSTCVRWDLYAQLGYPSINDTWDYLDVLADMQALAPANADGQSVYAISAFTSWDGYYMSSATLNMEHKGYTYNNAIPYSLINVPTNTLSNFLAPDSAYIDDLKWYFTANQRGILDPDSMTQTWNSWTEKMAAGRILFANWMWGVGYYNSDERVNADSPIGFAPLLPSNTVVHMDTENLIGRHWSWGISHNTQHLDRCLEYLDLMCNPDKLFTLANGPQGESWDVNEDGKPYLLEAGVAARADSSYAFSAGGRLLDGLMLINSSILSTGAYAKAYQSVIDSTQWESHTPVYSKLEQQWQAHTGYQDIVSKLVAEGTWTHDTMLAQSLVAPMSDDMQMIAGAIRDIVQTTSWLAVYAADEVTFNSMIAQMIEDANALGLEELLSDNQLRWDAAVALAANYQ